MAEPGTLKSAPSIHDLRDMTAHAQYELQSLKPFLEFCAEVLERYPKKEVKVSAVLGVVNMTQDKIQAALDALS